MPVKSPPCITADWTLEQLKTHYPGVELTLFAHFGIGSRERSGFSGSERLEDLLRRHLVFDAALACSRLNQLAREDWDNALSPRQLAEAKSRSPIEIVDARSLEDYERGHLSGARLLSAETVELLKGQKSSSLVVCVCGDGSQSPSASRVLRKQGLRARHLRGGLVAWSREIDGGFPVLYPLTESAGQWSLLADGDTLRYRRPRALDGTEFRILHRRHLESFELGRSLLRVLPQVRMVINSPRSFAIRGLPKNLLTAVEALCSAHIDSLEWNDWGESGDEVAEKRELERVLAVEAPEILSSHKGTVHVHSYNDRTLTLELGGGCAGCASAQITTQRELAAALYRAVPLLDRIQNLDESSSLS